MTFISSFGVFHLRQGKIELLQNVNESENETKQPKIFNATSATFQACTWSGLTGRSGLGGGLEVGLATTGLGLGAGLGLGLGRGLGM